MSATFKTILLLAAAVTTAWIFFKVGPIGEGITLLAFGGVVLVLFLTPTRRKRR